MKLNATRVFVLIAMLFFVRNASAQFQYVNPVPDSKYHNPEQTIILRNGALLDEESVQTKNLITVTGSKSGKHECEIKLVEGKRTIIAKPRLPFTEGETVTVKIAEEIKTQQGVKVKGMSFNFSIREPRTEEQKQFIAEHMKQLYEEEAGESSNTRGESLGGGVGFPNYSILTNTTPTPGEIFWHNFSLFNTSSAHYCITENNGDSVYGKFDTATFNNWDLNHNGYLTAYNRIDSTYEMFDSNYTRIASIQCGNGYRADVHEFQIYNDHQPYLFAYDPEIVDMTVYNSNYSPHATVVGLIVQQLDSQSNVIFEWRSWDHYNITDCDHVNLFNAFIDAVHGNSLEVDNDGNIIISARHLSELSKINRSTGDFIWRFGGVNNQFTFTNDANKISWQHDARRLANGHITVFDNGNYHSPAKTAAKEYSIDEVNHTATLVWSYTRTLAGGVNVFSTAMGSVQKLNDGHRVICWGLTYTPNAPSVTEVDSLGNVVWEMQITGSENTIYRARKYTWQPCSRPTLASVKAKNITATSAKITWDPATNATQYDVRYKVDGNSTWTTKKNIADTKKKIKNLTPSTKYDYEVRSQCSINSPSQWTFQKTFTTKAQKEDVLTTENDLQLNIYPNPAHDNVTVSVGLDSASEAIFTVYDLSGRKVYQSRQQLDGGEHSLQFNLGTLAKGMYLAEMKAEGLQQMQKIVIE